MSADKSVWDKQYLLCWVFNVGRGICAFIRTPSKYGIIIDCGGDAEIIDSIKKDLIPKCSKVRSRYGEHDIGQVILSHPHSDHISNIKAVDDINKALWTCPHDKTEAPDEMVDWSLIQNPEGTEGILDYYKEVYKERSLPLQVFKPENSIPNFQYGLFYIRPPECEPKEDEDAGLPKADYANNISMMTFFRFEKNSILFPGDMMTSGMKHALENGCENRLVGDGINSRYTKVSADLNTFSGWVSQGCSVLVAPHHGLESAFSEDFFEKLPEKKVDIVIISEKIKKSKADGNVHAAYQKESEGKVKGCSVRKDNGSKEKDFQLLLEMMAIV